MTVGVGLAAVCRAVVVRVAAELAEVALAVAELEAAVTAGAEEEMAMVVAEMVTVGRRVVEG
eukprot:7218761-Prymnesium_polylepis.1